MTTTTRRPSPTPAECGVSVGDFFVASWGYDQTNVDFYKVVGLTPKGVKVQKWTSACVRDNGPQVYVVPGPEPRKGGWVRHEDGYEVYDHDATAPVQTKRLNSYGEGEHQRVYFSVNSYSSASKWDGQPEYETATGFGH